MTTDIVLDAVEQAIWTRARVGITNLAGLVHHNDRGAHGGFNLVVATPLIVEVLMGRPAGWMTTMTGRPPARREVERRFWIKAAGGFI